MTDAGRADISLQTGTQHEVCGGVPGEYISSLLYLGRRPYTSARSTLRDQPQTLFRKFVGALAI
jgi:hypothetical protein